MKVMDMRRLRVYLSLHMAVRKKTVSIKLDPEVIDRIDVIADAEKRTRSYIVGDLVLAGLQQRESAVKLMTDQTMMRAMAEMLSKGAVWNQMSKLLGEKITPDQVQAASEHFELTMNDMKEREAKLMDTRKKRRKSGKENKS